MIFVFIGLGWLAASVLAAMWFSAAVKQGRHEERLAAIHRRRTADEARNGRVSKPLRGEVKRP